MVLAGGALFLMNEVPLYPQKTCDPRCTTMQEPVGENKAEASEAIVHTPTGLKLHGQGRVKSLVTSCIDRSPTSPGVPAI
jgi:hypothetical protein